MIFTGQSTKKGFSNQVFTKVDKNPTHVKAIGVNKFYPITKDLKIMARGDSGEFDENVAVNDMVAGEEYVIIVDKKNVFIEASPYAELSFMSKVKDGTGDYIRCEDNMYVRKTEAQVPSYKTLNMPVDHLLTHTKNNEHYAKLEWLEVMDKRVYFPNDIQILNKSGNLYLCLIDGQEVLCEYKCEEVNFDQVLVGDKIVDIENISVNDQGEYVTKIDDEDVTVGKIDCELEKPFVETSTIAIDTELSIEASDNPDKHPVYSKDGNYLVYTYPDKYHGPNGLLEIKVNKYGNYIVFIYKDREEVYAKYEATIPVKYVLNLNTKRCVSFKFDDLGNGAFAFKVFQRKENVATNVVMKDEKVNSYEVNGRLITDIQWGTVSGYDEEKIVGYTIDGVKISNVEMLANGLVGKCSVTTIDEDGNEVIENVDDLSTSPKYKGFAISYSLTRTISNVEFDAGVISSFKMGDYKFSDIEWLDGEIYKCSIKKGANKEQKVVFSEDDRFKQLKLVVATSMESQGIKPLMHSKLLEKKDDGYHLVADVVQTEPTNSNGVASSSTVDSVQQAVNEQKKFEANKFDTWIIDENGKVHKLSDFNTTYSGVQEFEYENSQQNPIDKILGKSKIEINAGGGIEIGPSKKEDNFRVRSADLGFRLIVNPITVIFAIPVLMVSGSVWLAGPIIRNIKKLRVKNIKYDKVVEQYQGDIKNQCKRNLNQYQKDYEHAVKQAKKEYSTEELKKILPKLRDEFKIKCYKEIGKLQVLGNGSLESSFDFKRGGKLSGQNLLAYLACNKKQYELKHGMFDHPQLKDMLKGKIAGENMEKLPTKKPKKKSYEYQDYIIQKVEYLQYYGGAKGVKKAYKLQKKHAQLFLKQHDATTYDNLDVDEFKQLLVKQYYETLAIRGGIKDKLKAYKKSDEYRHARGRKEKVKLLEAKKKSLKDEFKNVSADSEVFTSRKNSEGNDVVDEYSKDILTWVEQVVDNAENKSESTHKFRFGLRDKMSASDLKAYAPQDVRESIVQKTEDKTIKTMQEDEARVKADMSIIKEDAKRIALSAVAMDKRVKEAQQNSDYETISRYLIEMQSVTEPYTEKCEKLIDDAKEVKCTELTTDAKKMQTVAIKLQVRLGVVKERANSAKEQMQKKYNKEVEEEALDDYIVNHLTEWEKFVESAVQRGANNEKLIKRRFLYNKGVERAYGDYATEHKQKFDEYVKNVRTSEANRQKQGKKGQTQNMRVLSNKELQEKFWKEQNKGLDPIQPHYPDEFLIAVVNNNVDTRIEAEVLSSKHEEEYNKFKEAKRLELKYKHGNNAELSEDQYKCYYYYECTQKQPELIVEIEESSAEYIEAGKKVFAERAKKKHEKQARAEQRKLEHEEKKNSVQSASTPTAEVNVPYTSTT